MKFRDPAFPEFCQEQPNLTVGLFSSNVSTLIPLAKQSTKYFEKVVRKKVTQKLSGTLKNSSLDNVMLKTAVTFDGDLRAMLARTTESKSRKVETPSSHFGSDSDKDDSIGRTSVASSKKGAAKKKRRRRRKKKEVIDWNERTYEI